MLINCPKCGFSQPKDHYCAHCGVNIDRFRPENSFSIKKIFKNTFLQLSLVFIIAAATTSFILTNDQSPNKNQIVKFRKNVSSSTNNSSKSDSKSVNSLSQMQTESFNTNENTVIVEAQNEDIKNSLVKANLNNTQSQNINESSDALTDQNNDPSKLANKPISYDISFYEIEQNLYQELYKKYRDEALEQFAPNDIMVSQVNIQAFLTAVKNRPLNSEIKASQSNVNEKFIYGLTSTSDSAFQGITLDLRFYNEDQKTIYGTLKFLKSSNVSSRQFNLKLSLKKNHIFLFQFKNDLAGFENNENLKKISPFQILKSPKYINRETEFIFAIRPLSPTQ